MNLRSRPLTFSSYVSTYDVSMEEGCSEPSVGFTILKRHVYFYCCCHFVTFKIWSRSPDLMIVLSILILHNTFRFASIDWLQ